MATTTQATTYTKIKQNTDHDSRNVGPLVSAFDAQESTLNQTVISFTQLTCDLDRKSNVLVFIDGQLLREGVGNDYTWNAGLNNTSSSITLAAAIPAGLNIQAYKIGITKNNVANAETLQAAANLTQADVDQKSEQKLVNGAFDFWQESTSFPAIANSTYFADQWTYLKSGAMVHTVSRTANIPSFSKSTYGALVDCTTLDASIASGDYCAIRTPIEGSILRSFRGKNMVIGFNVYSTKTGTFCLAIQNANSAPRRSLVKEYTVSASNTHQRYYIRFTHDETGTWAYDTSAGMMIYWTLACGTTAQTTPDTWQTGDFIATANQVNACDSAANDFIISDVVLMEDNASLNKQPDYKYFGDSYIADLNMVQRYFEKSYDIDVNVGTALGAGGLSSVAVGTGGGAASIMALFKATKRVSPTITIYNPTTGATGSLRRSDAVNIAASSGSTNTYSVQIFSTATTTNGSTHTGHFSANARM